MFHTINLKLYSMMIFCQNITNNLLFGNKFLTFKKTTLFFKSWIQEGITAFKKLKIVNGKLDVNNLNEILIDKRQLHTVFPCLDA